MFSFYILLIKALVYYEKTMCSLVTLAQRIKYVSRKKRRYKRSGKANKLNVNALKGILALDIIEIKESVWVNMVSGQVGALVNSHSHPRYTVYIKGNNSGQIFEKVT